MPSIRGISTGDHVDQGGFTGTVLAEKNVDFTVCTIEIYAVQRKDARETLRDLNGPKQFRRVVWCFTPAPCRRRCCRRQPFTYCWRACAMHPELQGFTVSQRRQA